MKVSLETGGQRWCVEREQRKKKRRRDENGDQALGGRWSKIPASAGEKKEVMGGNVWGNSLTPEARGNKTGKCLRLIR